MYKVTHSVVAGARSVLTQRRSIYDQLCSGSRYLDVRPTLFRGGRGGPHSGHFHKDKIGATGATLREVFSDIRRFLAETEHETIVVSLKKFHVVPPSQRGRHKLLADLGRRTARVVHDAVGSEVHPRSGTPPLDRTLQSAARAGRIILHTKERTDADRLPGLDVFADADFKVKDPYTSSIKHEGLDVWREKRGKRSAFDETSSYQLRELNKTLADPDVYRVVQWIVRRRVRSTLSVRRLAAHMNREAHEDLPRAISDLADHNARQRRRQSQRFPNALMFDVVTPDLLDIAMAFNDGLGGRLLDRGSLRTIRQ